jgi:hypothetical protein
MFGVLVVVFRRDDVAASDLFLGQREISLVASLRAFKTVPGLGWRGVVRLFGMVILRKRMSPHGSHGTGSRGGTEMRRLVATPDGVAVFEKKWD